MATLTPQPAIIGGLLPQSRQPSNTNAPGGLFNEMLVTEALPKYYPLVKSGNVFTVPVLAANPAAFTGGAAGTPLLGIYNPANSGKDLVMLWATIGIRSTGTAAATTTDFNWFGVNQGGVAVTGTQSTAYNVYSQAQTGSIAYCMVNVANTAALASTLRRTALSLGNVAATAALNVGDFTDYIDGGLIVAPGCYLALGCSLGFTAGSIDVSAVWAEVPV